MKSLSILFFAIFAIFSCTKNNVNPDTGIEGMTLLWKKQYHKKGYAGTFPPILHNDLIICSKYNDFPMDTILALDKNTGKEVWRWADFKENGAPTAYHRQYKIIGNTLVFTSGRYSYGLNANTGKLEYAIPGKTYGYDINYSGNNFLRLTPNQNTFFKTELRNGNTGALVKVIEQDTVKFENILNVGYYIPFANYNKQVNDTILYYPFCYLTDPTGAFPKSDVYLMAYSLKSNKILFKVKNGITPTGATDLEFSDKYVYTLGYQNITCFDKLNGKIIWNEKLLNDNSLRGLFVNEKIAIVVFNEKVTILDASTGKKIKEYTDKIPGGVAPTFTEYKNTVYFVSQGTGILFAFDATTGERKWTLDSPDKKIDSGYFFDRFVIDPTTDKMYIFNYKNLLCYQLPK